MRLRVPRRRRSRVLRVAETMLKVRTVLWLGRRLWRPALSLLHHRRGSRLRLRLH